MDQERLITIIDKFESSGLSELKLETDDFKLTLRRQPKENLTNVPALPLLTAPETSAASSIKPQSEITDLPATSSDGQDTLNTEIITSPIVGMFYRSPAPDAPPYVDKGSKVAAGDSLCVIEAMKIMNKLEADYSCEIINILAENGAMIEYGAPLFEVKRD